MSEQLDRIEAKLDKVIEWLQVRDGCICFELLGYRHSTYNADGLAICDRCHKPTGEAKKEPGSTHGGGQP